MAKLKEMATSVVIVALLGYGAYAAYQEVVTSVSEEEILAFCEDGSEVVRAVGLEVMCTLDRGLEIYDPLTGEVLATKDWESLKNLALTAKVESKRAER